MKLDKDIKINRNEIYKGRVLTFHVDDVRCPNGNLSKRECVEHPGGVCVLPILDNGNIILEKQYRYPFNDFIIELPAGKLEANEDALIAGIRELEEETGYKSNDFISLGCIYPSVGYTNEIIYLYVAKNLKKTTCHFDEDENLETFEISLNKAIEMIQNNEIVDAKTVATILKYQAINK